MKTISNEGKACDAVIRLLERQTGEDRTDILHPERTGDGPPVEIRLNLGTQKYAIEHTQIEAFPGQIHTGEEFRRFIGPVVDELSRNLPGSAVYYLYFPIDARLGVKAHQIDEVRRDFVAWVCEHAQRLHEMNPKRPTKDRNPRGFRDQHRATPPSFPYEVTLQRQAHWARSPRYDGTLLVSRMAPENVEELRATRLRKALETKCPKLRSCKADGARTVLVLEDSDISLSNYVVIGDGLAGVLALRDDLPDEIYLVETAVTSWTVRRMKHDNNLVPAEEWDDFESADLVDITGSDQG